MNAGNNGDSQLDNLDQIREILFGTQSRDIDTRLQAINDQLAEAMGGLRALLQERTDALTNRFERELRAVYEQLDEIRQSASQQGAHFEQRLQHTENDLRQTLGALGETMATAERTLRNESERGLQELRESLQRQLHDLREHLQQDLGNVSRASVSRRVFRDALLGLSTQFDDGDN